MSVFDSITNNYQNLHGGPSLCNYLKQMKLYKVVLIASLFLIIVPLIIHYYLVNVSLSYYSPHSESHSPLYPTQIGTESHNSRNNAYRSRAQLDIYEDYTSLKASDLKLRIDEMVRIKVGRSICLSTPDTRPTDLSPSPSPLEHRLLRAA